MGYTFRVWNHSLYCESYLQTNQRWLKQSVKQEPSILCVQTSRLLMYVYNAFKTRKEGLHYQYYLMNWVDTKFYIWNESLLYKLKKSHITKYLPIVLFLVCSFEIYFETMCSIIGPVCHDQTLETWLNTIRLHSHSYSLFMHSSDLKLSKTFWYLINLIAGEA